MLSIERHEKILEYLDKLKAVKVADLSDAFHVTEKTIRADLISLEQKGMLKRIHGGAVSPGVGSILPIAERQSKYVNEKTSIAKKAIELLSEEETIFLDGGSTIRQLAEMLGDFKVTVVTNDVKIANILIFKEKVDLIMLGGYQIGNTSSLYGPLASDALQKIRVSHLFLGTTGIDCTHGLSVFNRLQADYKKSIINAASRITLLADHTKFGQNALIKFADLSDVDLIISDIKLNPHFINEIKDLDTDLILAD
ncbi:DeoR/GlpR family DNA-binding transcription regulator [Metabacillus idriensis]|uniref:DeoR/GlpR family DNA-binding transcription regulator n=1 Tax=Metabacillus idriensis TaxID=324768 RepID=UPI00174C5972|nr:DeoR/GlpR family DNA-binding transcription regulator [Metabacillus idriensis]